MTISIDLSPATEERLRAQAEATGKNISTLVVEAVEARLSLPQLYLGDVPAAAQADPNQTRQFDELAEKWKSETRFISNVTKKTMHPSYQRIIGMGESAVPLILREMSDKGPDDWFWALTAITGENPITEDIAGNMNAMMEAWLKWGATTGYLNDSRPKTKNGSQILPQPDIE